MARGAAAPGRRPHQRRPLGGRVHGRDDRHAGSSRSRRGPTAGRPGTTSCGARSRPTSTRTSRASSPRASCCSSDAASARQGRRRGPIEEARAVARRRRRGRCTAKFDVALGPELFDAMEAAAGARRRDRARDADADRGRPRARPASAPGTSCSRARWGGLQGGRGAASRRSPTSASTSSTCSPIHPIGRKNRKGRNNTLDRRPGRPRLAVRDRRARRAATTPCTPSSAPSRTSATCARPRTSTAWTCALDIALNASADHPWLTEHPEWFQQRPDGTLKYAENPPKRYQDIYNFNWDTRGLAGALGGLARRLPALGRRAGSSATGSTTRTRSRSRSGSG